MTELLAFKIAERERAIDVKTSWELWVYRQDDKFYRAEAARGIAALDSYITDLAREIESLSK